MLQKLKNLSVKKKIGIIAGVTLLIWFWLSLPTLLFNSPTSYVIEDNQERLLGAAIASDGQWRFPYNEQVPEKFAKAIVAFEDKRFYSHSGVDPLAFARAIRQNISSQKVQSGGSTITMQVIRLSGNKPRTFLRKLIEMVLAFRLELSYSKKEILALYASNAPFGSNVVGLDAASWRYFGRSPDLLSWGEIATLAVLPNSPALVHPGRNRKTLLEKRNRLLNKLQEQGEIDATTCRLAKLEPIPDKPLPLPQLAPHLLSHFRNDFKKSPDQSSNTRIVTTIQTELQNSVRQLLDHYHTLFKANGVNNAAAIVLDVESGNTLAYVGNIYDPSDPEVESHVDVIPALRSPGSTLKPLLYASMLSEGIILPNTLVADIPTQIAGYTPQNFDLGYDGAVPASRALARSLNIPAVKMLQSYRVERFHEVLKKLGISSLNKPSGHYGLSLILGGGENSLWEIAGVYASLARTLNHHYQYSGSYNLVDIHPPYYFLQEKENTKPKLEKNGVLDAGAIWCTFNAMEEVMRPGEEQLWQQFNSSQRVAWKTGTSFGFRDGWAIGLTPKYVVAVWVGNADGEGRPGLTGISTAAPILFDIFRLLTAVNWFDTPYDKLTKIPVCHESGSRAGISCNHIDSVWIPKAGLRSAACPYHRIVHLDKTAKWRVSSDCESPANMINKSWFVLPPAMEFYYRTKNQDYQALPPYRADCAAFVDQGKIMELLYPKEHAKIYVPIEIDGTVGNTIFSAAHRQPGMKIFWHLDDKYVATTSDFHQLALNPKPGKHKVTLVDENGERAELRFEILQK